MRAGRRRVLVWQALCTLHIVHTQGTLQSITSLAVLQASRSVNMHICTHRPAHALSHTHPPLSLTHSPIHSPTHSLTLSRTPTTHTHTHTHTHITHNTHTHTHAHTHTHTHRRTHTHTHKRVRLAGHSADLGNRVAVFAQRCDGRHRAVQVLLCAHASAPEETALEGRRETIAAAAAIVATALRCARPLPSCC